MKKGVVERARMKRVTHGDTFEAVILATSGPIITDDSSQDLARYKSTEAGVGGVLIGRLEDTR